MSPRTPRSARSAEIEVDKVLPDESEMVSLARAPLRRGVSIGRRYSFARGDTKGSNGDICLVKTKGALCAVNQLRPKSLCWEQWMLGCEAAHVGDEQVLAALRSERQLLQSAGVARGKVRFKVPFREHRDMRSCLWCDGWRGKDDVVALGPR
ncbi:hypothetical protein FIBSPDRAFT_976445 [Athelia psychrophila]|uniref:Uncharacterized protein n=1 Tax=Athelia psychrophila TaxID=1759441 RepID=A0A166EXV6_9AGAM|nr:hypothetical protein FIBSPDRAFT_976445 [Fibularhizoctonia sp. CBS 109695]